MKISALSLMSAAILTSAIALADAANTLITFSTPGPDKYADGTTVVDGERYALVWTAGEDFAGFTTTGEAVDANQKVIYKASLAKDGRCPLTLFQIDSAVAPVGGVYSVYLLDTRAGTGAAAAGDDIVVTGSALAKTYATSSKTSKTTTVKSDNTIDAEGNTVSLASSAAGLVDTTGVAAPKITSFKIDGANVKITVSNIFPGFAYEVRGGLDRSAEVAKKAEVKGENTIELTVSKDDAQFFSVKAK